MKRYLIDTNLLAAYLFNRQPVVSLLSPWISSRQAATSILVYGEVIEYLKSRPDFAKHQNELRELLREVSPYFLTYGVLERYADVRRALRPPYGPGLIGDIDTLIAATTLERNLTIVTTDPDFQRVPGLSTMLVDRNTFQVVSPT